MRPRYVQVLNSELFRMYIKKTVLNSVIEKKIMYFFQENEAQPDSFRRDTIGLLFNRKPKEFPVSNELELCLKAAFTSESLIACLDDHRD